MEKIIHQLSTGDSTTVAAAGVAAAAVVATAGLLYKSRSDKIVVDKDGYYIDPENGKRYKAIPSIPGYPVIGNLLEFNDFPTTVFNRVVEESGEQTIQLDVPGDKHPMIASKDADLLEIVMAHPDKFGKIPHPGDCYVKMVHIIPDTLLSAHDHSEAWGMAHRLLLPTMSTSSLRSSFPYIVDRVNYIINTWSKLGPKDEIDCGSWMTRLTFDVIGKIAMGQELKCLESTDKHPYPVGMSFIVKHLELNMLLPDWWEFYVPTKANRMYFKHRDYLRCEIDKLMVARKAGQHGAHGTDRARDALDVLLEDTDSKTGKKLNDVQIRDNLLTLLFAGHDTTSALLCSIFYLLSRHPHVEEKIVEEVHRVIGPDREPTFDDINKLQYVGQVVKEAARLKPSIALVVRRAFHDMDYKEFRIKKDQQVAVCIKGVQTAREYWGDDAHVFNPDRFSPENDKGRKPFQYLPFAGGVRGCIGAQLAIIEAKTVVAMVLRKMWLRLNPEMKINVELGLTSRVYNQKMNVWKRPKNLGHGKSKQNPPLVLKETDDSNAIVGGISEHRTPLTILYGSAMGTSQGFADMLYEKAQSLGFAVKVDQLDSKVTNLPKEGALIIITPTYNGTPPDNARDFEQWIVDSTLDKNELRGVQYAVFGCGNKAWVNTWQHFPTLVDSRLEALGATRLMPRGEGDAGSNIDDDFHMWQETLWPVLFKHFSIELPKITIDHKKELSHLNVVYEDNDNLPDFTSNWRQNCGPYEFSLVKVLENRELQAASSGRSTRHIEVELPEGIEYETGDHLGVSPINRKDVVMRAAKLVCAKDGAPRGLNLQAVVNVKTSKRTLYPTDMPLSVETLLKEHVDLLVPVNVKMLASLAAFATNEAEAMAIRKLSEAESAKRRKTILDVLEEFKSISIGLSHFIALTPALKPRYYSISSSPNKHSNSVHITVGVVHEKGANWEYHGVASGYLANVAANRHLQVFVRASNFHLPANFLDVPMILIGPGTGFAPFRGFLQEREVAMKAQPGVQVAPWFVFFGCRRSSEDYIYREELEHYENAGVAKLSVAFSREEREKVYVQHKIRSMKLALWQNALSKPDCHVYVCGDASKMAPDVRKALEDIVAEFAPDANATQYIGKMKALGRYLEDVWG